MKTMKRGLTLILALLLALSAVSALAAASVKIDSKHFPDAKFRKYIKANFDTNGDGSLSTSEIKAVDSIEIDEMGISRLNGIEYFTSLEDLVCNDNNLKKLDLRKNKKLEFLDCEDNQLTVLRLPAGNMTYVHCEGNQLTSLDLSGNTYMINKVTKELMSATSKTAEYGYGKDPTVICDVRTTLTNGKTILRKYGKPKAVAFTKSALTVKKGWDGCPEDKDIFVKMTPATAVYPFKITSDNTSVLSCDSDRYCEARKKGTANLTVKCGNKKGTLKVTVK